jgi:hypothetical protein
MKKVLIGLLLSILVVIGLVFTLLFTSIGNGIVKPMLESKINDNVPGTVTLRAFELSTSALNVALHIDDHSSIVVKGNYSLFGSSADLTFNVDVSDLAQLKAFTGQQLNGPLHIAGSIKGDQKAMDVIGESDIAGSTTSFNAQLKDFQPQNVTLDTKAIQLDKLLHLVNQPQFANGTLNIQASMKNLMLDKRNGNFSLSLPDGQVNHTIVQNDLGIALPKATTFTLTSVGTLQADLVKNRLNVNSNLARVDVDKTVFNLSSQAIDTNYALVVPSLEALKSIIGTQLNGSFKTDGTVKGHLNNMVIDGRTNLFETNNQYNVGLKEFKPTHVHFNFKQMKLASILHTINQPNYADALVSVEGKLDSLTPLNGTVMSSVKDGMTNQRPIQRDFNITMPDVFNFHANTMSVLQANTIKSNLSIISDAANITTENTLFNLKEGALTTDYKIDVANLNNLQFVTNMPMKGAVTLTGNVKQSPKELYVDGHSDTLEGSVDYTLKNNQLKANLKNISVLALTDMLIYPRTFKSVANADVTFDLLKQKGEIHAKMNDGQLLPTTMTNVLKTVANIDLEKELYNIVTLDTSIIKDDLISDLYMKSGNTEITSKKAFLNKKSQAIKAKIKLKYKERNLGLNVSRTVTNPKVSIDMNDALKQKATDKLKDKVPEKYKGALDGIMKLF